MDLSFYVNKPSDVVFDYLTDMQKLITVHPVIFKIDPITANHYLVFEKLRFAFIPVTFTYTVEVSHNFAEKSVVITGNVKNRIKIEMNYRLLPEGLGTRVNETVLFQSRWPVKRMMSMIFRKQHKQLFKTINDVG